MISGYFISLEKLSCLGEFKGSIKMNMVTQCTTFFRKADFVKSSGGKANVRRVEASNTNAGVPLDGKW
jgi:hypothetical protein